jgi:hypothetical protein
VDDRQGNPLQAMWTFIRGQRTHAELLDRGMQRDGQRQGFGRAHGKQNFLWALFHHGTYALTAKGYVLKNLSHIPRKMIDERRLAELVHSENLNELRNMIGLASVAGRADMATSGD